MWRLVQTDGTARPSPRRIPWRDRNLWLQLLIVAALVLALAGPTVGGENAVEHWVVLIDASTSMNATDVAPTRLDRALSEVVARFSGRSLTGAVSVVRVGVLSEILAARWAVGPDVRQLATHLEPGEGAPDWTGAALRASELLSGAPGERGRIVVMTDRYGASAATEALSGVGIPDETLEVHVMGSELVNIGFGDVEARERGSSGDQWTVSGTVAATGFAPGDVVRVVASYRFPGTDVFLPWGGEDLTLAADLTAQFSIPLDLPGPGVVKVSGPAGDQLEADDAVYLSLEGGTRRVAIIGPTPPALLAGLAAVGGLEVYGVDVAVQSRELEDFDLVIVTTQYESVPPASALWFGAVPPEVAVGDPTGLEGVRLTAGTHTLMADVDPMTMGLQQAQPLRLLAGAEPLLTGGEHVFGWARTAATGRQVVLGFGLDDSNWASQVTFPAFISTLLDWVPKVHLRGGDRCKVGVRCAWPRAAYGGAAELYDPAGGMVASLMGPATVTSDPLADAVWDQTLLDAGFITERSGLHELRPLKAAVAVPVVTDLLGPQPQAPLGEVVGAAVGSRTQLWPWLVALAVTLVMVETYLAYGAQELQVRRRSRLPLLLAAVAAVLGVTALSGAPFPSRGPAGTVTWLSARGISALLPTRASGGWNQRLVRVNQVAGDVDGLTSQQASHDGATSGVVELNASDPALALEMALAAPPASGVRRVVVAADDLGELPAQLMVRLGRAAAELSTRVDVGARTHQGAESTALPTVPVIELVRPPVRARAHAPYVIEVDVRSPASVEWTLTAELVSERTSVPDGEPSLFGAVTSAVNEQDLPGATPTAQAVGVGTATVRLELNAGRPGDVVYHLAVEQSGVEADTPGHGISVQVGPGLRVLMVAPDDVQGVDLAAALAAQGVEVARVTPLRMPATTAGLGRFDAVVTVNLPAATIFQEYQTHLESYVRDSGGGLLMFGGPDAFGPGGYYATPMEDMSPLSSVVTDDAPEVAMAFVLDRSGSMSGAVGESNRMDLAKAATLEAVSLLGESSQVAIVVFDTVARLVVPFTPVTETGTFVRALASVTPAGGTAIYPGLAAVQSVMASSPAATRHVVVLTDGLSQEGDFEGVLGALKELGVSTSFVGVGSAADRRQLTTLANLGGGALHMAQDFRALPGLLAQEALMLAAEPIEERLTQPRWTEARPPEFLIGIAGEPVAPLRGYVRTTAKPEATVHLTESVEEDPLLATWRYGLGRVASFASEADGPWALSWRDSPLYGQLWSQVVRWLADVPTRVSWSMRMTSDGEALDVSVDLPAAAVVGSSLPVVELWSADGLVARRSLARQAGTGVARFYVGHDWAGELEVRLTPVPGSALSTVQARTVPWPLLPLPALPDDLVPIERLATLTGGELVSPSELTLPLAGTTWAWAQRPQVWISVTLLTFLAALAARYGAWSTLQSLSRRQSMRKRTR
jgi:uncharacterized membrane protein